MSSTPLIHNPLRTNENDFAIHTMQVRLPAMIRQIQKRHAHYPALIQRNLDVLHDALLADAPIPMLQYPAPDADMWALEFAQRHAETWKHATWFFAEVYFFRQIIQAVRYFENGIDPFLDVKLEEFYSPALKIMLPLVLEESRNTTPEGLHTLLSRVLWGNRADLSLVLDKRADDASDDDILADDRTAVVERILTGTGGVHIITDNAGTELAMDLVWADALLQRGIPVMLHVKMHPTYVSDATAHDVWYFISDLIDGKFDTAGNDTPAQFGLRLSQALDEGHLRLAPDFYWNSARWLDDMPLRIQRTFEGARLVMLKGDANYRRAIHDTLYPAATPFADYMAYFPAPFVALRTIKSDAVIGLPTGTAERLQADDPRWRITGQYGLIQFKP